MKIIYPLFQREIAYIGIELMGSTVSGSGHHGAYSESTRRFKIGDKEISGNFGVMKLTGNNLVQFKTIYTIFNPLIKKKKRKTSKLNS